MKFAILLTFILFSLTCFSQDRILLIAGINVDSISKDCFIQLGDSIDIVSRKLNTYCTYGIELKSQETIKKFFRQELKKKDNVNDRILDLTLAFDTTFYTIPNSIHFLKNLSRLEVSFFTKKSFPITIRKCFSLKHIWLLSHGYNNPEIPTNITKIKNLESIFIAHDGRTVPKDYLQKVLFLKKCKTLKYLKVYRTNFTVDEIKMIEQEFTLKGVKVDVL